MSEHVPTRDEAMALLKEFNRSESLIKHALSVEAVMRQFAKKYGENEEMWGIIGLVHDLDYEQFPDRHCQETERILNERGWRDDYIRAVLSHAWEMHTDLEPQHRMEKVLYAIDELTGLVAAAALVRPSKSVMDIKPKSVKKKWKDKRFAAGVNREVIQKGAQMLGVELPELIQETILGMRTVAEEIGLAGELAAEQ